MKKLLPPGIAFGPENKTFHQLLKQISIPFDESREDIKNLFSEVPGSLKETLALWAKLLNISYDGKSCDEINKEITAKLTAVGSQSMEYLTSQLIPFLKQGESLRLEVAPEELRIQVYGVNRITQAKVGIKCGEKLAKYKRNEAIVRRFREIRYAEIEARYHG